MEKVCDRLRQAMQLRGIKQTELADKCNINKGSINHFLQGKYQPKSDKIYLLAKVLRVNPAWLLGYDVPIDEMLIVDTTTTIDKITKKVEQLDEAQRQMVLNMLEAMFPNKEGGSK